MDDYDDLVEKQRAELKKQKEEKRRREKRKKRELLQTWEETDENDCSCDQSGTAIFSKHSVSFLLKRDDFDMATEADELWVCDECGRIPPEKEVRARGISQKR